MVWLTTSKENKMSKLNEKKVLENLHIKPLVNNCFIKEVDPFSISYIREPKLKRPCLFKKKIDTIIAFSYYSYYGFFRPSVGEVIDAIPHHLLKKIKYFQIDKSFSVKTDHENSCHIFKVHLYKGLL